MSRSRLRRRIVRVDPALHEALTKLAERLFSETRSEYSRSAVTRGVTALGLRCARPCSRASAPVLGRLADAVVLLASLVAILRISPALNVIHAGAGPGSRQPHASCGLKADVLACLSAVSAAFAQADLTAAPPRSRNRAPDAEDLRGVRIRDQIRGRGSRAARHEHDARQP